MMFAEAPGQKLDIIERFIQDFDFDSTNLTWVNSRNSINITPLQAATLLFQIENEHARIIFDILLSLGANPSLNVPNISNATQEEKDNFGWNAIAFAASKGVIGACEILYTAHPECIHAPTGEKDQFNAFIMAALRLDRPMPRDFDQAAIEIQTRENCKVLMEWIVTNGYSINTFLPDKKTTPLEYVVRSDLPEATKFLIKQGAALFTVERANMMHIAAMYGAQEAFEVLSILHPELITGIIGSSNITPLMVAIDKSLDSIVAYILHSAWPASDLPLSYQDPLLLATLGGKVNVVQKLVDIGWEVNGQNDGNGTALQQLCSPNVRIDNAIKVAIARIIISSPGFNTTIGDKFGQNSMHNAVMLHEIELCKMIKEKLYNFAILNSPNLSGVTYLSQAIQDDAFSIVDFEQLLALNPTIINVAHIQNTYNTQAGSVISNKQLVPITYDVPIPTDHVLSSQYPNKWVVPVKTTPFTEACKHGKLEKAECLSAQPNLLPFTDNTHCNNIHYARMTSAKIVHNILDKEPGNINYISSFGATPLALATQKLVAQPTDKEAQNIVAELIFHGATITPQIMGLVIGQAEDAYTMFDHILNHAAEIHASLHAVEALGVIQAVEALSL